MSKRFTDQSVSHLSGLISLIFQTSIPCRGVDSGGNCHKVLKSLGLFIFSGLTGLGGAAWGPSWKAPLWRQDFSLLPSVFLLGKSRNYQRSRGALFYLGSLQGTLCDFCFLSCACRNPLKKLYQQTFYFHFKNVRYAWGRKNNFLCYEVNGMDCALPVPLRQGVFRKQVFAWGCGSVGGIFT